MKTLILSAIFLLAFGVVESVQAQSPQTLRVGINREKTFSRSKVKVRFVSLVEDSRCPTDTNCVWAGNAKINVQVRRNGSSKTIELNTGSPDRAATFAGYKIELTGLTPEPRSNIRINRNGYVATIVITRISR